MSRRAQFGTAAVVVLALVAGSLFFVSGAVSDTGASAVQTDEREFTATSSSGRLVIGGSQETSFAIEEGTIEIEGVITDGRWESTDVEFADIESSGISASVSAPDGLEGEFDPEAETVTLQGEIVVVAVGEEMSFGVDASSETASADADIGADGGSVVVVDDSFAVGETGNSLIDDQLGLPAAAGQNQLVLPIKFDIEPTTPELTLDTDSIKFTELTAGENATETITVENTGSEQLGVTDIGLSGNPAAFTLDDGGSFNLAVGEQRQVAVNFAPDDSGIQSTQLIIESDDPAAPRRVVPVTSSRVEQEIEFNQSQVSTQATIQDVASGERVEISVPDPDAGADDPDTDPADDEETYSTESIGITPSKESDVELDVTTSSQSLDSTPDTRYGFETNTTMLGNVSVETNVADEDIEEVALTIRVNSSQLDAWDTDAGNVSLYRFNESQQRWVAQATEVVERHDGDVLLRGTADHPSEWTAAAARPAFEITQAEVGVAIATVEETVAIDVFVENTGGTSGTYVADLLLDGEVVETRESVIADGGEALFDFERTFDQQGVYEIQVNDEQIDEIEITDEGVTGDDEASTDEASTDDSPEESGADGSGDGFGVVLAVVAVFGSGLLARR